MLPFFLKITISEQLICHRKRCAKFVVYAESHGDGLTTAMF